MPALLLLLWSIVTELGERALALSLLPRTAVVPHICDQPALDLDGDGVRDRFDALQGSCGTGGCQYRVALSPAPSPDLGVIDGCWFERGDAKHHGRFDVVATWRLGTEATTTRYRFDGRRYRPE